jgi:hypothetical protein
MRAVWKRDNFAVVCRHGHTPDVIAREFHHELDGADASSLCSPRFWRWLGPRLDARRQTKSVLQRRISARLSITPSSSPNAHGRVRLLLMAVENRPPSHLQAAFAARRLRNGCPIALMQVQCY